MPHFSIISILEGQVNNGSSMLFNLCPLRTQPKSFDAKSEELGETLN